MEDQGHKRASAGDGGPPEKRLKGEPEDTELYSKRIQKKLQTNSRTGQACDRCKERKMKCDSGPDGCQPCQKANLTCKATDRITGQAHERGETSRLKKEVEELKGQVDYYRHHLGLQSPAQYSQPGAYQSYVPANGYHNHPPQVLQTSMAEQHRDPGLTMPKAVDGPYRGPIHETTIDFIDGEIDIAAYDCPDMSEIPKSSQETLSLNNSRRSSLTTILGVRKPDKPQMPPREDAIQYIEYYLKIINPYVPIVHGPTVRQQVMDYYDDPSSFDDKPAEIVIITVMLAIICYQMATRNPTMRQEKLVESNRLYHYALSFYPELLLGDSLTNMQALTLFLVHARNLPKPGNSWSLSTMVLTRAIELKYHRSSHKIELPPEQHNPLSIELRKRVFWSIVGIQVTTAIKLGRPMAISTQDMDVELPHAVLDTELNEQGFLAKSGSCDFWGHIFVSKKLPLLIDLYQNVVLVRKPEAEYLRDVDELDAQISKWRREWDQETAGQPRTGSFTITSHLIDMWYAEFRITLYHPRLCTSQTMEAYEKNLDVCLEASRTILQNVISLIRDFKGADFTWHFVSGYVLAMGMTLHAYNRRKERLTVETFNKMRQELGEWLFVMRSADAFMRTGDHLFNFFYPRVQQCLGEAQTVITASEALQNGYHHGSQPPTQQGEASSQQQSSYSTAEPFSHPTSYSNNHSSANALPPTSASGGATAPPQPLPQPRENYNTHPPKANNTDGYHITVTSRSPQGHSPSPANPFVGDPDIYPSQHPQFPHPVQPMFPTIPGYPPATQDISFPTTDIYSTGQAIWPVSIMQYQNGGIR